MMRKPVHWSFWIIVLFSLLWNLGGCLNLIMQMNPKMLSQMPESHQVIVESRPGWATLSFAISSLGAVIGCILLVIKKASAKNWFVLSFVGVLVTMFHALGFADAASILSPLEMVMTVIMPLILAVFLIWYSRFAGRKNWIV